MWACGDFANFGDMEWGEFGETFACLLACCLLQGVAGETEK
jgi:hypothetical protein